MKSFYRFLLILDILIVIVLIYSFHSEMDLFITTHFQPLILARDYNCKDCNVVIVVFDALRPDHLHTYGYYRNTSPDIDRFTEEAILFENAYSPSSWTKPAVASIFTSLYPSVHGSQLGKWEEYKTGNTMDTLSENVTTIAEILKENGYRTIAFSPNPLLKSIFGYGQGFETYVEKWKDGRKINDEVIALLKNESLGKFFVYLHYMDTTHQPYRPPKEYDRIFYDENDKMIVPMHVIHPSFIVDNITDMNYYLAQYDALVLYADDLFSELLRELPDDTIIILTADHGDEIYEHGGFGHGGNSYEETIHVPLIIKIPNVQGGKRVDNPVNIIDILPTILDILDIGEDEQFQGKALIPNILNDNYSTAYVYSETKKSGMETRAVISERYKLIYDSRKKHENDGYELYDLKNDPKELNNIINQRPEIAERLREMMAEQEEENRKHKRYNATRNIKLDEDAKERLKYLGYLE